MYLSFNILLNIKINYKIFKYNKINNIFYKFLKNINNLF